ncbi:hypothetical protein [Arthrobacter sp. HLT1-20]
MTKEKPPETHLHGSAGPGLSGYRKGCRCPGCKKLKRDDNSAYRAKQKLLAAGHAPAPDGDQMPLAAPAPVALDWNAAPGLIESTLNSELETMLGDPPFKKTLMVLGRYNARVLDQIPRIDRPDLISGMQSRLFNVFDRLRYVNNPVGGADGADAFLADLLKSDD